MRGYFDACEAALATGVSGGDMGSKAERDEIRTRMLRLGCPIEHIAIEMGRRFNARPRLAWRYALGWTQVQLALRYNEANNGHSISPERVSECENWPNSRTRPSLKYLVGLARTFGHGCTAMKLTDLEDLSAMPYSDRVLVMRTTALIELPPAEPPRQQLITTLRASRNAREFRTTGLLPGKLAG